MQCEYLYTIKTWPFTARCTCEVHDVIDVKGVKTGLCIGHIESYERQVELDAWRAEQARNDRG